MGSTGTISVAGNEKPESQLKILWISYFYPPMGGPAVLRNIKSIKYLADLGCIIDVITVKEPQYLYRDQSLCSQQRHRKLFRTLSWDLMSLLKLFSGKIGTNPDKLYLGTSEKLKQVIRSAMPIDDKIGWLPSLLWAGKKALKNEVYDFIFVSGGPFSSMLGAQILSRYSKTKLVLDYRDYWTLLSDYKIFLTPLHRAVARICEQRVLQSADFIVSATAGIAQDLQRHFKVCQNKQFFTLYNGWDEADFASLEDDVTDDDGSEYEIAYFGALYAKRSLRWFFAALKELLASGSAPQNTVVRLYGNFFTETYQEIENSGIAERVKVVPQLTHAQALMQMKKSRLLLLLINSDSPQGTLTSKVFEYLRVQKPILAMVPTENEAANLLRQCGHNNICPMESISAIKHCLQNAFDQKDAKTEYIVPIELERGRQVKELYHHLYSLRT